MPMATPRPTASTNSATSTAIKQYIAIVSTYAVQIFSLSLSTDATTKASAMAETTVKATVKVINSIFRFLSLFVILFNFRVQN